MPPKKRSSVKRKSEAEGKRPPPAFCIGSPADGSPPVPSLVLADALVFADTMAQVLQLLAQHSDCWMEAIVLATPFWAPGTGRLNQPVDLAVGIPPLVAASLRFDPGRELRIRRFAPHILSVSTKGLLATLERIRVDSQFPRAMLPALIGFMPKLNGFHLGSTEQLEELLAVIPHGSVEQLGTSSFRNRRDLGILQPLTALRKLTLDGCNELIDVTALKSLTKLEELSLGGCEDLVDVSPLASLTSLPTPAIGDVVPIPLILDEDVSATTVPGKLLGTYAASLRSDDPATRAHGEVMIRKIVSVDRNPWSYGVESDGLDIPDDLLWTYIDFMRSTVLAENLHGARMIGYLLDTAHYFVSSIISQGIVGLCVHHLLCDDLPELQNESALIVQQVAEFYDADTITSTPHAIPNLVRLLCSPVEYCREAAARAIKEIASASIASRDCCLECGALEVLLPMASYGSGKKAVAEYASWALSSCCQGLPPPDEKRMAKALPVLTEILYADDVDMTVSAATALSHLSEGSPEHIDRICESDCCLLSIFELLYADSESLRVLAASCIRNVARGSGSQVQALINEGAVQKFPSMLSRSEVSIQKDAAESISIITADHPNHIPRMITANVFPALLTATKAGDTDVTEHAVRALLNSLTHSSVYVDYFVEIGALQSLGEVVAKRYERTMAIALETMEKITNTLKPA